VNDYYKWFKFAYPRKMADEPQCRRAVELNKIDAAQFKEITGKDF